MRYSKPIPLCGFKERPDAACRNRPRCKRCNRALSFGERDLCPTCRNIRDRTLGMAGSVIGITTTQPQEFP